MKNKSFIVLNIKHNNKCKCNNSYNSRCNRNNSNHSYNSNNKSIKCHNHKPNLRSEIENHFETIEHSNNSTKLIL